MIAPLVLSLFPGIGLFDHAFELEGFVVVRGPDIIWGGDVRRFVAPVGVFEGIIGGPPCQVFSQSSGGTSTAENLIPEFERIVFEASPRWFVMENVPQAPEPVVDGYAVACAILNNRWLGEEQSRARRFSFGCHGYLSGPRFVRALAAEHVALENPIKAGCFTANGTQWEPGVDTNRGRMRGRSRSVRTRTELHRGLRLQGLPADYLDHCPFTVEGAIRAVGNGVPVPMGRAVARAVKAALGTTSRIDEEVANARRPAQRSA